ncbi:MAG TPA: alginate lyase family protein [Solidesulfovibrio magneticus]|nr:alginate lyase family protein [Solidesulfovibrio magneticus]
MPLTRLRPAWPFRAACLAVFVLCWLAMAQAAQRPALLFVAEADLQRTKAALAAGDPALAPALGQLREECAEAMAVGRLTVTDKKLPSPSADPRDYVSRAPYWWPDPDKPDGLPPIRKDGEVHPDAQKGDVTTFEKLADAVGTLALGYYLTGEEQWAAKAAGLLRAFFLDPATAMRPHLRYGQLVPGQTEGSGFGLIDLRRLPEVCDAASLLVGSPAWSAKDMDGLRAWMQAYLDWLLASPQGRQAREAANNHGTWHDVQAAGLALFCGKNELAREVLARFPARLAAQVRPDGEQPLELARTRSLSYSLSNLEGLFRLMQLGDRLGLDLWALTPPDAGTPRKALDYLLPYLGDRAPWPGQQITPVGHNQGIALMLRLASVRYSPTYDADLAAVFGKKAAKRCIWLLYPPGQ